MSNSDHFNQQWAQSPQAVDEINKAFYEKYNYPWPPMTFEAVSDQRFSVHMLHQDFGDWSHTRLGETPNIWVAGCGTNQALYTALKFPESTILGTDISVESLETCQKNASQIGIKNLILEEKSINEVCETATFDYILCTGVIHHNADPAVPLRKISAALKPNGILELMVYNYYHRILTTAFQKAIRSLCNSETLPDFSKEMACTQKIIKSVSHQHSLMANFLSQSAKMPEAGIADSLLQPVEFSYTVESLAALARSCGLELLLPCVNQFDKALERYTFNLHFEDSEIAHHYESLPDIQRWQIANLLMVETSPMLWFYLQRVDSEYCRKTERQVCEDFLDATFTRTSTATTLYVQNENKEYTMRPKGGSLPAPPSPSNGLGRKIFENTSSNQPMRKIFEQLGIEPSFQNANRIRIALTTTAFPYLESQEKDEKQWKSFRNKISGLWDRLGT